MKCGCAKRRAWIKAKAQKAVKYVKPEKKPQWGRGGKRT